MFFDKNSNLLDMNRKKCSKCQIKKDFVEFHKDKSKKDSHSSYCRLCAAKKSADYQKLNKKNLSDYNKEYNKEYRRVNRDKIKINAKDYWAANKIRLNANKKIHYYANKIRLSANHKVYREANKEVIAASKKIWAKKNIKKSNATKAKYRARKFKATPKWADLAKIKEFYINCPDGYHVDHVIPLQGKNVCGIHVIENLQYLTAEENIRKSNQFDVV